MSNNKRVSDEMLLYATWFAFWLSPIFAAAWSHRVLDRCCIQWTPHNTLTMLLMPTTSLIPSIKLSLLILHCVFIHFWNDFISEIVWVSEIGIISIESWSNNPILCIPNYRFCDHYLKIRSSNFEYYECSLQHNVNKLYTHKEVEIHSYLDH